MKLFGTGVSPRRLTFTLLALVVVAVGALALVLLALSNRPLEEGVEFADFSADSTATVVFAGEFPPLEREPLGRPIAIDGDGERLYVLESDPGQVSVRGYDGALLATFTVEAAPGAAGFFPIDVEVLRDGRLGIVDGASPRVLLVDPDEPDRIEFLDEGPALLQPTSIEADDEWIAVADAGDGTVRLFSWRGRYEGILGRDLRPPITFVGDTLLDGEVVWVSDSNAGRVIALDIRTGELVTSLQQRFDLPRGLDRALGGRLAVVDTFSRQVVLFDQEQQAAVDIVGDERTERFDEGGELGAPESCFWDDAEDRLYVVDPALGRVKVYGVREAPEQ